LIDNAINYFLLNNLIKAPAAKTAGVTGGTRRKTAAVTGNSPSVTG
jgi:hypothetical protein